MARMYDTLHLWLSEDQAKNTDLMAEIPLYLNNKTEHNRAENITISGHVGNNLRVNVSESGISLKGSICKYFHGNNFQTLTRSETEKAIEKLSDEIHLPIEKSKVFRLDFAENLEMKYTPETYYNHLGNSQHYRRLSQPQSIYYANGLRTKLFYDKGLEGANSGQILPYELKGKNLLRYELRFKKNLPRQFNKPVISASHLTDQRFYTGLIKRWVIEYEKINKLHLINLNFNEMDSPKDFIKQMAALKISEIGELEALQFVEQLRSMNAFKKPEYYSRLKREIKNLCKSPDTSKQSDLITELDQKIKEVKNGMSLI